MQDLIAKGAAWFDDQRRQHMAVTVKYKPLGSMFPVEVRATIGTSRFDSIDTAGQVVRFESRDYFISVEDMKQTPVRGDRILETDEGGTLRTYEVTIPGGQNNPWTWADRGQRIRRIHTSLVS